MKEENCKCCNEVWNKSDIKEGLCPNCYYYFKSIKKQNQTQKAIECLKEIKKQIVSGTTIFWIDRDINKKILQDFSFEIQQIIKEIIDNKIKELEEKN